MAAMGASAWIAIAILASGFGYYLVQMLRNAGKYDESNDRAFEEWKKQKAREGHSPRA